MNTQYVNLWKNKRKEECIGPKRKAPNKPGCNCHGRPHWPHWVEFLQNSPFLHFQPFLSLFFFPSSSIFSPFWVDFIFTHSLHFLSTNLVSGLLSRNLFHHLFFLFSFGSYPGIQFLGCRHPPHCRPSNCRLDVQMHSLQTSKSSSPVRLESVPRWRPSRFSLFRCHLSGVDLLSNDILYNILGSACDFFLGSWFGLWVLLYSLPALEKFPIEAISFSILMPIFR